MGIFKINYFGNTLFDLTGITVRPEVVQDGEIAVDADGNFFRGSLIPNVTNLSVLHLNMGSTGSGDELRSYSFTVYGQVNSMFLTAWGYMSSTTANSRRVVDIANVAELASISDRYMFLAANGGASTSAGYGQAQGYITGFNGVSYSYNSSTDITTITITLPNSNMSGYAGKPRLSGHYHCLAFYVEDGAGNIHDEPAGSLNQMSFGDTLETMEQPSQDEMM